ncbi:MAG: 2-isopropylmalate synthase [bacterium]|nr:2-isopropylmalate synthase [bacterium]
MIKSIKIFDTTLRDGEQSPGCSMNKEEKLEVAYQLENLGVDIIEAGFAISSRGDFDSIDTIARHIKTPVICSLARARKEDIDAAAASLEQAENKRIHTFIATSDIHIEHKLRTTPDKVIQMAVESVKYAKSFVQDIQFSAEDAGRSNWDFLVKILSEVIKAGATTLNIPDTVGYMTTMEYGNLIKYLKEKVSGIDTVDLAVHCHNDLGLGTANSLAGIYNGATQIECTVNGIGERAGNTALEEVVMAIETRKDFLNSKTKINTREIMRTSRLVSNITGSFVQPNKSIVGANAFAHESGIHQDGILKQKQTYEIIDPEAVGLSQNNMVIGKHSGRHAFSDKVKELGFDLTVEELNKAFKRFKQLADKKKEVSDRDIESIIADEVYHAPEIYSLEYVQIVAGNTTRPTACVQLISEEKLIEAAEMGAGPVDAIYKTIDKLVGQEIDLVDFSIHSVTGGTDALGEVTVRIRDEDKLFIGRGSSMDVLVASAKAYLAAINKMLSFGSSR